MNILSCGQTFEQKEKPDKETKGQKSLWFIGREDETIVEEIESFDSQTTQQDLNYGVKNFPD